MRPSARPRRRSCARIEERHRRLAAELGVPLGEDVERHFAELREIAAGVALVREVSDRTRARVMATGELMATADRRALPARAGPGGRPGPTRAPC